MTASIRTGLLLMVGALAAAGCGGGGDGDAPKQRSPAAGLTAIGAGAGAAPAAAPTLKASTAVAVERPFPRLRAAGPVLRITASSQPRRPVEIALPLERPPSADELPIVAVASSARGPWEPLPAELRAGGRALVFKAPHFSFFTSLFLPVADLLREAKEQIDGLTSGALAEAKAPSCPDEQAARTEGWKATGKGPGTVKWCFGRRDGRRIVKIVNARRYPLSIAHPGAKTIASPRQGVFDLSKLSAKVSPGLTLLPPRESVTYAVESTATFRIEADGLAQSLYQLQFGAELALTFWTRFGTDEEGMLKKLLSAVVDSGECLNALKSLDNGGTLIKQCFGNAKLLAENLGVKGALLAAVMTVGSVVEFFHSEFNALGDEMNGRTRYSLRIEQTVLPVLGVEDYLNNGAGWGEVAPETVFNGGSPGGLLSDITWSNWGADTASGFGLKPIYKPNGGYYAKPVRAEVRATRLATCPDSDRPAYTRLLVRYPKRPGGPIGDFSPWALNLCDYDQKPDTCGDVGLASNSDYGAFEITAWDVGCAAAKRLAKQVARIAIKPGSLVNYSTHQDGFSCEGYSLDETDGLPEITWTCSRDSAQVAFKRS